MVEIADLSLVNWSRAQFALTAMYHWLFVPLTLGITFIIAFMETLYVKTGNEEWKRITKFWMTLFGINFAIGVATGIILEFEFGTNWSNYSWFVAIFLGPPSPSKGFWHFSWNPPSLPSCFLVGIRSVKRPTCSPHGLRQSVRISRHYGSLWPTAGCKTPSG